MRHPLLPLAVAAAAVHGVASAGEQENLARRLSGRATYRTHCAVCHGVDANGDGSLADRLRVLPPDLTLLARRNRGVYPEDKIYRIIDGRDPVKGHGGPDMPIWGDAFKGTDDGYSEAGVKDKIGTVVEYLRSIQASAK